MRRIDNKKGYDDVEMEFEEYAEAMVEYIDNAHRVCASFYARNNPTMLHDILPAITNTKIQFQEGVERVRTTRMLMIQVQEALCRCFRGVDDITKEILTWVHGISAGPGTDTRLRFPYMTPLYGLPDTADDTKYIMVQIMNPHNVIRKAREG
jgi:hypothetical protein